MGDESLALAERNDRLAWSQLLLAADWLPLTTTLRPFLALVTARSKLSTAVTTVTTNPMTAIATKSTETPMAMRTRLRLRRRIVRYAETDTMRTTMATRSAVRPKNPTSVVRSSTCALNAPTTAPVTRSRRLDRRAPFMAMPRAMAPTRCPQKVAPMTVARPASGSRAQRRHDALASATNAPNSAQ